MKKLLLLIILSFCCYTTAAAQQQSLPALQKLAKSYLEQQVGKHPAGKVNIQIGRLDQRLQLNRCDPQSLVAYLPPGATATNTNMVGIRCQNNKPWSIYIPVKVQVLVNIVVTTRPFSPGETIRRQDLRVVTYELSRIKRSYYQNIDYVVGKVTKQPLSAGSPLSPQVIRIPDLIQRGELVTINAEINGIRVTMPGIALANGTKNQIIKVKNRSSNRVIEAKIKGPKYVQALL